MKILPHGLVWGILASSFLSACVEPPPPRPPRSQLEVRQTQTREYSTRDSKMVMKALVNVLQDEGFVIHNAVVDLGLITATKDLPVEHVNTAPSWPVIIAGPFGRPWGGGHNEPMIVSKHSIIEASANVSEFGKATRVRISFQEKTVDNRGGTIDVHELEEPDYYQDFFSKVDKGIFIQREKL